jgi:hypothetical protein
MECDVVVIAQDASFGAASHMCEAICSKYNCIGLFELENSKGFYYKNSIIGFDKIPEAKTYIVISSHMFLKYKVFLPKDRTKVIINDSYYLENYKETNMESVGYDVYCMADKMYLMDRNVKVFYHTFDINIPIIKNDSATVCHSPFSYSKSLRKGTYIVTTAINEIGVDSDIIFNASHEECLIRKSKCHIFIDQIVDEGDYKGGLGKSGIEAMLLKCLVMSGGRILKTNIPKPPIVVVDKENLKDKLVYFINNESHRNEIIQQQYEWANKYTNKDFFVDYILK